MLCALYYFFKLNNSPFTCSTFTGGFTVSLQDQLIPVEYWGKTFVSLSFSETVDNSTDIYQIMGDYQIHQHDQRLYLINCFQLN